MKPSLFKINSQTRNSFTVSQKGFSQGGFRTFHLQTKPRGQWRFQQTLKPSFGFGLVGMRFYSTPNGEPKIPNTEVVNANPAPDVSTAIESLERFTREVAVPSSGHGAFDWWQPVQWSVELLEQINLVTGSPWWATIVLTTFSLRLLLFPLGVKAARHNAKVQELQPAMTSVQAELVKAKSSGDVEKQRQVAEEFSSLLAKANPFKTLLYILPQAPIFICMFLALRRLAENHPEFHTGGMLWFTDLAASDPYMRLPILAGVGFLLAFEVGADAGAPAGDPRKKTMRYLMYPMMTMVVFITASFPQAVHLYWLVSSAIGILQVALFRQPAIQKILDLPARRPHLPVPLPSLPSNVVFQPVGQEGATVAALNPRKLSKKYNDRTKQ